MSLKGKDGRLRIDHQNGRFSSNDPGADSGSGGCQLLAYVDRAHGNLSGPAPRRILEREYGEYGQAAYQRLAGISGAQLCRLRNTAAYRKRNTSYQPTRPTPIPIGERRKPQPQGKPGYLRVDTVHQGDQDGDKGLYHINAVDEVTQWEIVAATPQISVRAPGYGSQHSKNSLSPSAPITYRHFLTPPKASFLVSSCYRKAGSGSGAGAHRPHRPAALRRCRAL
jgi:hypothetical protein